MHQPPIRHNNSNMVTPSLSSSSSSSSSSSPPSPLRSLSPMNKSNNNKTLSPSLSSTNPTSSSLPFIHCVINYSRKYVSRTMIIFFGMVAIYDTFISYQYHQHMRQLLSLYQPLLYSDDPPITNNYVRSSSSSHHIHHDGVLLLESTTNRPPYYYYDRNGNTNLLPNVVDDARDNGPVNGHRVTHPKIPIMDADIIEESVGVVDGINEERSGGNDGTESSMKKELFGAKVSDGDSLRNNEMSDEPTNDGEPWILNRVDKKLRVQKSINVPTVIKKQLKVGRVQGMRNSVVDDDKEEVLFQDAIRKNEHVSLYHNYQEYIQRSQRFPSIEERVKLYMSTWYNPPIFPCNKNKKDLDKDPRIHYNYISQWKNADRSEYTTTIVLRQSQSVSVNNHNNHKRERLFTVDHIPRHTRMTFAYNYTILSKVPYKNDAFIADAFQYFTPSLRRVQYPDEVGAASSLLLRDNDTLPHPVPIMLQVGDSEQYRMYATDVGFAITRPVIPVIKKFRYSMEPKELSDIINSKRTVKCNPNGDQGQPRRVSRTVRLADNESLDDKPYRTQPIISIMSHTKRHYGPLVDIPEADRPWNTKFNMAVYRGALTGMNKATVEHPDSQRTTDEEEIKWCKSVPRCNLVLQHGTSKLVNAKITKVPGVTGVTEGDRVKPVLNGVTMEGESMNYNEMLQYKAIIMLEGNDVSSGLKWALFSNSVVMMSKPTCTSWTMEELLQPYVHYIPLNDDLSNVEEQVQWMIDHDVEAEQIARNGHLWMTDLVFHPDAAKDTEVILDETFRRYMQHFQYNPTLELSDSLSTTS